jgi:hypothetical protein
MFKGCARDISTIASLLLERTPWCSKNEVNGGGAFNIASEYAVIGYHKCNNL